MEGTYDDDLHREQGFETFDDWLDAQSQENYLYDYEENPEQRLRSYLRKFSLKQCNNSKCTGNLVLKFNKIKRALFWGCSEYPKCKFSSNIFSNVKTISKCNKCNAFYRVEKIYDSGKISLKCENERCQDALIISIDDFL